MKDEWHGIKPSDIKDCDGTSRSVLLQMAEHGWECRRSTGSHLQLRAPNGTRGTVSPNNKYNCNYLRQLFNRGGGATEFPKKGDPTVTPTIQDTVRVPCPRPGCPKVYASLIQLDTHIKVDHEHLVACSECDYWATNSRTLNLHRSKRHGYESPKKAERKRQEAARKAPAPEPAQPAEPASGEAATPVGGPVFEEPTGDAAPTETEATSAQQPVDETIQARHLEFIDERESWTLDLSTLDGRLELQQLHSTLRSVGLNYEIRVWKL